MKPCLRFGRVSRSLATLCFGVAALTTSAHADRLKDLASIQGVRQNQLIGYGLVVGLDGSGDQTTQTPFTVQSVIIPNAQLQRHRARATYRFRHYPHQ